jgi:uncharacterized protein Yka (UPF0111/DUF47 family)
MKIIPLYTNAYTMNTLEMAKRWLSWVRSNDKAIIDVLAEQAENLVKATSTLVELMTKYDNVSEYLSKITDMEHEGD